MPKLKSKRAPRIKTLFLSTLNGCNSQPSKSPTSKKDQNPSFGSFAYDSFSLPASEEVWFSGLAPAASAQPERVRSKPTYSTSLSFSASPRYQYYYDPQPHWHRSQERSPYTTTVTAATSSAHLPEYRWAEGPPSPGKGQPQTREDEGEKLSIDRVQGKQQQHNNAATSYELQSPENYNYYAHIFYPGEDEGDGGVTIDYSG